MICMYTLEHYVDNIFIFLESCIKTRFAPLKPQVVWHPVPTHPSAGPLMHHFWKTHKKVATDLGQKEPEGLKLGKKGRK